MHAPPCRGRQPVQGMRPSPDQLGVPSRSPAPMPTNVPHKPANAFDAMEREHEAVVNKLQREITVLKETGGSGRSRSSSVSSNASTRSTSTTRTIGDRRASELEAVHHLRRENEALRKQLAKLSALLAEREAELQNYQNATKG